MSDLAPSKFMGSWRDPEHAEVWRWLEARCTPYPVDRFIAPLRPRSPRIRPRRFHGGAFRRSGLARGGWLDVSKPDGTLTVECPRIEEGRDDDVADALDRQLLVAKYRGTTTVFADGARDALHRLLRLCWRRWVELGYRVKPLGFGTELRYVVVSKSKHAWYFADFEAMTGLDPREESDPISILAGVQKAGGHSAVACRLASDRYQEALRGYFGVSAGLSVGSTAMAVLSKHIPDDGWVWRPSPQLVALCRSGGGFRGGHIHYPPYRGGAHRVDMRRAYTWALSLPLPGSAMQGACERDGAEQPGIYLAHVYGPGTHPISIAEWRGEALGFVKRNWCGDEATCVLSTEEVEGIRALGYGVSLGYGFTWRASVDLSGFVAACERVLAEQGPTSPIGLVAKRLANAIYGKLAEAPTRMETVMAADRPSDEHRPFLDAAGIEVEDVWCRELTAYRPNQHVDMAAVITARVRGRLYRGVAALGAAGVRLVAADTDGLLVDRPAPCLVAADGGRPGDWRDEGYEPDVIVAGPRMFTWRGRTYVAGTSPQPSHVLAVAWTEGTVTVEGKVMAPPWSDGAMVRTVEKRLRRSADRH